MKYETSFGRSALRLDNYLKVALPTIEAVIAIRPSSPAAFPPCWRVWNRRLLNALNDSSS